MHTNLAFAVLSLVHFLCTVAGKPVPATHLPPITIADVPPQRSSRQPLTLISPSVNGTYLTLHRPPDHISPPTQSNSTLKSPEGSVTFRVPGSRTTLFFHNFGARIPTSYILDTLALSLTRILELTLDGKGKDLIHHGYFHHIHMLPNHSNVTISVADFREVGRPMDYDTLRDTLSGIGDFLTEPGRKLTAVSYEIEVDGRGYVGTGHVDYDLAGNQDASGL